MKNLILIATLIFSVMGMAQSSTVEVIIDDISSNDGVISIAVYDNASDFIKKEIKTSQIKAKKGTVKTTIKGLSAGTYAIAVLHDANENNEMDFNMLGIPKEDYGFSNNAKGVLAPPKFQDAAFVVKAGQNKQITIKL